MKYCSSIVLRPLCFLMLLGISGFLSWKLGLMNKQIDHRVTLQTHELRNKSFSEIKNSARLLPPLNLSASNLARALGSSLNGTELSFQAIETKVAPTLFLALSTIPHLSQVSYIGLDGLLFSFYNDGDQTLAVFTNDTSLLSISYTQPVNRDTGKPYGEAISSKSLAIVKTSWFQKALNRRIAYSSLGTGWNKDQDPLFLHTMAMDGRGVISIGFPAQVAIDHIAGLDFHGGDFHLATNEGQVLVETRLPDIQIVVNNGTVSLNLMKLKGVIKHPNNSCHPNDVELGHFSAKIRGMKYIFYCSTLEIAGVQSVYVLAFPTKGLESLVHKNSNLALTLLVLMFVIVLVSLGIFILLILRAARREMFLCAALIKQMEATQQAERKSINKSMAFASASHDVRASLAAITGLIGICQEDATPNSVLATNLLQMNTCGMDLVGILDSVLDRCKIEAGKMQLEEEEFNLALLLEDVVDMHYTIGMKKGVDVVLDVCDGSIFKLYLVKGDRGKLKQILWNLLSNAVKFTSEGHVSVRAVVKKPSKENAIIASNRNGVLSFFSRLCCKNNASYRDLDDFQTVRQNPNFMEFVFEVDDTGKGIPKDMQKSVFEHFVQVKETALGQGGCGLGLGIVQSMVRLMGGEIKIVDKEPGERGTCFRFNIFLATCHLVSTDIQEQADYTNINNNDPPTDFYQHFGQHCRSPGNRSEGSHVVLLIPADERRKISKKLIENLGIKVSIARRGRDLFHILEKIKHKLDHSQPSSSEKNNLRMIDYLTKSGSNNSNSGVNDGFSGTKDGSDHPVPYYKKSNSKSSSSFILIVVDACAGTFSELCSIVGNFKKDIPKSQCKVVWLDNPNMRSRQPEEDRPPWDHFLSKPFHGSRLYRVLGLLPEFGGPSQHLLQQIVIHKHDEKSNEKPLNGKKVLVVEDKELLRRVATAILCKLGASVDLCENGKEAFDQVCKVLGDQRREGHSQALPYDYIFMDCEMPVMNGYEATRLIRMEEKHYGIHTPIIALTAHAMAEEAIKCIHAGMDFHLKKPLEVNKLLDVIRSIEDK